MAGRAIYERDLTAAAQGELRRLRQREYKVKREALEAILDREIVGLEASRLGITQDQLFRTGADHASLLRQLQSEGKVTVLFSPPRTPETFDPMRLKGDPSAPVTIVEFGDFECPFCRQMEPTLAALLHEYRENIRLAYLDFPLREVHPHAELAAEASRCAEEQGMFWEFHDQLFAHAHAADRDWLLMTAEALRLDQQRFKECLNTGKYIPHVEQDLQQGIRSGVSGTPTFFVNGIYLGGAQSMGALEEVIDTELAGRAARP
ncbi:MAG: DsbA family protein [Terriglobales bacterium]